MNVEAYRQFGMQISETPGGIRTRLNVNSVRKRVQRFLCDLYGIKPHKNLVYSPAQSVDAYSSLTKLRLIQDRDLERLRHIPKLDGRAMAATFYTADLDMLPQERPDYVVLFFGPTDPSFAFAYPVVIGEELTHGEHMCFHIGRDVENHREYHERFSPFHLEHLATLARMYIASKLGVSDELIDGAIDGNDLFFLHRLGYMSGRIRWKRKLAAMPEGKVRTFLSDAFKSTTADF
jgi:hypothetical protein